MRVLRRCLWLLIVATVFNAIAPAATAQDGAAPSQADCYRIRAGFMEAIRSMESVGPEEMGSVFGNRIERLKELAADRLPRAVDPACLQTIVTGLALRTPYPVDGYLFFERPEGYVSYSITIREPPSYVSIFGGRYIMYLGLYPSGHTEIIEVNHDDVASPPLFYAAALAFFSMLTLSTLYISVFRSPIRKIYFGIAVAAATIELQRVFIRDVLDYQFLQIITITLVLSSLSPVASFASFIRYHRIWLFSAWPLVAFVICLGAMAGMLYITYITVISYGLALASSSFWPG